MEKQSSWKQPVISSGAFNPAVLIWRNFRLAVLIQVPTAINFCISSILCQLQVLNLELIHPLNVIAECCDLHALGETRFVFARCRWCSWYTTGAAWWRVRAPLTDYFLNKGVGSTDAHIDSGSTYRAARIQNQNSQLPLRCHWLVATEHHYVVRIQNMQNWFNDWTLMVYGQRNVFIFQMLSLCFGVVSYLSPWQLSVFVRFVRL